MNEEWRTVLEDQVDLDKAYVLVEHLDVPVREFFRARICQMNSELEKSNDHISSCFESGVGPFDKSAKGFSRYLALKQLEVENASQLFRLNKPQEAIKKLESVRAEISDLNFSGSQFNDVKNYTLAYIALFTKDFETSYIFGKRLGEDSFRKLPAKQATYFIGTSLSAQATGRHEEAISLGFKASHWGLRIEKNLHRVTTWAILKAGFEALGNIEGASFWSNKISKLDILEESKSKMMRHAENLKATYIKALKAG